MPSGRKVGGCSQSGVLASDFSAQHAASNGRMPCRGFSRKELPERRVWGAVKEIPKQQESCKKGEEKE